VIQAQTNAYSGIKIVGEASEGQAVARLLADSDTLSRNQINLTHLKRILK
jgi:hypothetical protein